MKMFCSNCGGSNAVVVSNTLDDRFPMVKCGDCSKRGPGIREDAFDRKRWQEQKQEAEMRKAAKVR